MRYNIVPSEEDEEAIKSVVGSFIDDREDLSTEVQVGLVYAPIACGSIDKIDTQKALNHPHCLGIYTASDIAAKNWGAIVHDQQFLASSEVKMCVILPGVKFI